MARTRIDLQPVKTIASEAAKQPGNEAAVVGQGRQGVAYLHVFKTQTTPDPAPTFAIDSASDANLSDAAGAGASGNFWYQVGTSGNITGNGVYVFSIADLGAVIRWRIPTNLASEFSFSCTVFLAER